MELALFIWVANVLPSVSVLFVLIMVLIGLYCLIKILWASCNSDCEYTKKYMPDSYAKAMEVWKMKWIKKPAAAVIIIGVIVSLIPTEKTMYLMLAGFAGQKVVQSEAADKVVQIINKKLDEYLVEAEKKLNK